MPAQIIAPIIQGVSTFLSIYLVLIFIRILLSWFPNIDWSNSVFSTLSQLTDPYLNIFRGIIPPIGGLDLSAIIAIFALQILSGLVSSAGNQIVAMAYYSTY